MNPIEQLRFAVSDRIDDIDVSTSHVPLALLGDFQKDVSEFLKGSNRDIDPSRILVSIENGSLAFVVRVLLAANALWADLEHLKSMSSLSLIDPKRANIIERWQSAAQKNPHRRYLVGNPLSQTSFFSIDSTSNFQKTEDIWVHIEKYLYGNVVDIGGKTKPNVHLELENGTTLTIAATQSDLAQGEQNRLYRPALRHITAEENLITGKLRNYKLLKFDDYQPSYDEVEFDLMVKRGTKAWSDVPDTTAWLEDLRGNHA